MIFQAFHRTCLFTLRCELLFPPLNNEYSKSNINILLIFLHDLLLAIYFLTSHITYSLTKCLCKCFIHLLTTMPWFEFLCSSAIHSLLLLALPHLHASPGGRLLSHPRWGQDFSCRLFSCPRDGELLSLYWTFLYFELPAVYRFTVHFSDNSRNFYARFVFPLFFPVIIGM